jgi:8-oxo-dGTP diphosphatase
VAEVTLVHAAGGVVWRRVDGRIEVVLVHRPHYDDWTFPKGKRKGDESDETCALREVEEETGLRCSLGEELPSTEYVDSRGRPKIVRWWTMEPLAAETSEIDEDEVDEARWVSTYEASLLLTYGRDRRLLDAFAAVSV